MLGYLIRMIGTTDPTQYPGNVDLTGGPSVELSLRKPGPLGTTREAQIRERTKARVLSRHSAIGRQGDPLLSSFWQGGSLAVPLGLSAGSKIPPLKWLTEKRPRLSHNL